MPPTTIQDLPVELLHEITGHYISSPDDQTAELLILLCVNNGFRAIALDYLFNSVTISYAIVPHDDQLSSFIDCTEGKFTGKFSGVRFLDLLLTSPLVASRVSSLEVLATPPESPLKEDIQYPTVDRRRSSLQTILPLLTSLDHLVFTPRRYRLQSTRFSWRTLDEDSQICLENAIRRIPPSVTKLDVRAIDYFPLSCIIAHPNLREISFERLDESLGYLEHERLPLSLSSRPLRLSHLSISLDGLYRWTPHVFNVMQLQSLDINARSASIKDTAIDIDTLELLARSKKLKDVNVTVTWNVHMNCQSSNYPDLLKTLTRCLRLHSHNLLRKITLSVHLSVCLCGSPRSHKGGQSFFEALEPLLSATEPRASTTIIIYVEAIEWAGALEILRFGRFIDSVLEYGERRKIKIMAQNISVLSEKGRKIYSDLVWLNYYLKTSRNK